MTRFILARLALLLPTLLGVLMVTFLLLYVAPGDPVQAMVGERADSATVARLRAELHLDDPLALRFLRYAGGAVHGDLGRSYITRRPILTDLLQRFPATLRLAGAAMLFATLVGVSIGIYGAWRPGSWPDRAAALGAYLGVSFPVYWVGLILILVFAVTLRWLPPSGAGGLAYLVLPALTLGMRSVAFLSRMTRAAMQEVLQSDFVRTARAKGLPPRRVLMRHVLRNSLIPIVSLFGLDFAAVLGGGAILTETVFDLKGVGWYAAQSVGGLDLPPIMGVTLYGSFFIVLFSALVDFFYAYLDPRIRPT